MNKCKTTCAVIFNAEKEVLLIRRAREPFKNSWALISGIGGIEKGLAPEESVKDEVYYDLNVRFNGKFIFSLPVENDPFTDEILVFQGTVEGTDIHPNSETVYKFGWFSQKDITSLSPLAFEHNVILDRIKFEL